MAAPHFWYQYLYQLFIAANKPSQNSVAQNNIYLVHKSLDKAE